MIKRSILSYLSKHKIDVDYCKTVYGGINSSVNKIVDQNGQSYALKIYPIRRNAQHVRNRFKTETDFFSFLSKIGITCVPSLILSDHQQGWILLEWIEGEKITALHTDDLMDICAFFISLNSHKSLKVGESMLGNASDAFLSSESIILSLKSRIDELISIAPKSTLDINISNWLGKVLVPNANEAFRKLERISESPIWRSPKVGRYISPSDSGIHNMIRRKDGSMIFIDFEYAGVDDVSKFLSDLILHPDHSLSRKQENEVIEILLKRIDCFDCIDVDRYFSVKKVQILKWCMIMLREYKSNSIDVERWDKIQSYYHKHF